MANLPFVVKPRRTPLLERIGSEESGIIEIERRGYLTTGEKAFTQQVQQADNGSTEIVTLSRRVARRHGLGMDRAYKLVLAIIGGVDNDEADAELITQIETEFAEDLTSVVRGLASGQSKEELIFAACMLRYRVDEDFAVSEINSLHPDLIEGLAKLYRDEETRSLEAFDTKDKDDAPKQSVEEIEKKPARGIKSRSKTSTGA
jgi:hypothetical protein